MVEKENNYFYQVDLIQSDHDKTLPEHIKNTGRLKS
jgi:hypothetical protein